MHIDISQFNTELSEVLKDVGEMSIKLTESGLDKAAKLLKQKLISMSPKRYGNYKNNWKIKKVTGARKISNSTLTKDKIPLSNILEFSSKGSPHIIKAFESVAQEMTQIIKNEFNK